MAKGDISLIFLAPEFPGIPQKEVHVLLSDSYNRKQLSEKRELEINDIWAQRIDRNPSLYDASKFRYHSMQMNNGRPKLALGLTSYKDFLGTNWAPDAAELRSKGTREHGNPQSFMSDALGVGNFLETSDGSVVFIRRSQKVGEAQGLWDVPGGHPEPGEVQGGSICVNDIFISELSPSGVLTEFYESTLREIRDEINVPLPSLSEPMLMGVAANNLSSGRPSAEFYVRCCHTKDVVLELYQQGGAEADESSNITFIAVQDIPTIEESLMWQEMAPSAKGCMTLYNSLKSKQRTSTLPFC